MGVTVTRFERSPPAQPPARPPLPWVLALRPGSSVWGPGFRPPSVPASATARGPRGLGLGLAPGLWSSPSWPPPLLPGPAAARGGKGFPPCPVFGQEQEHVCAGRHRGAGWQLAWSAEDDRRDPCSPCLPCPRRSAQPSEGDAGSVCQARPPLHFEDRSLSLFLLPPALLFPSPLRLLLGEPWGPLDSV